MPPVAGIKRAGGAVTLVGPKRHPGISSVARKPHALRQQLASDAFATRLWRQQKQAQFCSVFIMAHAKDGPKALSISLCDPAPFACGIVVGIECLEDRPHKWAKSVIEPFGQCVMHPVGIDQPIGVGLFEVSQSDVGHRLILPACGLPFNPDRASTRAQTAPERAMSINKESDIEANLQIGPTDKGMVRIYVEAKGVEIPMDFDPEEANEIADEIKAAAKAAGALRK